jgi:hypothetical protein
MTSEAEIRVIRNVFALGGMTKIIYVTDKGVFLGEITITAANPDAVRAFAPDFENFLREAGSRIIKAGNAVPGTQARN